MDNDLLELIDKQNECISYLEEVNGQNEEQIALLKKNKVLLEEINSQNENTINTLHEIATARKETIAYLQALILKLTSKETLIGIKENDTNALELVTDIKEFVKEGRKFE